MTFKSSISVFVLAAMAVAGHGQSAAPATSTSTSAGSTTRPALEERSPRYQLRKSDSFEVDFALSPELNQTITVQPDGYITLKSAGTIVAEGLTIPELTEKIRQAYSGVLHDPIITIELKDFDKPYFIASGQVGKPGKY